jgi:hypothetical protein
MDIHGYKCCILLPVVDILLTKIKVLNLHVGYFSTIDLLLKMIELKV